MKNELLNLEEAVAACQAAVDAYSVTAGGGTRIVEGHTQALLRVEEHRAIIAIAGTDDVRDMLQDGKIWRKSLGSGVRVHRGFWECYLTLREALLRECLTRVPHRCRLILTGHSLGGGMVLNALLRDWGALPPNVVVHLFGCPAAGNRAFLGEIADRVPARIWRWEHNNDFVVRALEPVYDHAGTRMYIDRRGRIHEEPGWWTVAGDRLAGRLGHLGRLGTDGFGDHGKAQYLDALKKNLEAASGVKSPALP